MTPHPSRPLHAAPKPHLSRTDIWTAVCVAGSVTCVALGALLLCWAVTL